MDEDTSLSNVIGLVTGDVDITEAVIVFGDVFSNDFYSLFAMCVMECRARY